VGLLEGGAEGPLVIMGGRGDCVTVGEASGGGAVARATEGVDEAEDDVVEGTGALGTFFLVVGGGPFVRRG